MEYGHRNYFGQKYRLARLMLLECRNLGMNKVIISIIIVIVIGGGAVAIVSFTDVIELPRKQIEGTTSKISFDNPIQTYKVNTKCELHLNYLTQSCLTYSLEHL